MLANVPLVITASLPLRAPYELNSRGVSLTEIWRSDPNNGFFFFLSGPGFFRLYAAARSKTDRLLSRYLAAALTLAMLPAGEM